MRVIFGRFEWRIDLFARCANHSAQLCVALSVQYVTRSQLIQFQFVQLPARVYAKCVWRKSNECHVKSLSGVNHENRRPLVLVVVASKSRVISEDALKSGRIKPRGLRLLRLMAILQWFRVHCGRSSRTNSWHEILQSASSPGEGKS